MQEQIVLSFKIGGVAVKLVDREGQLVVELSWYFLRAERPLTPKEQEILLKFLTGDVTVG